MNHKLEALPASLVIFIRKKPVIIKNGDRCGTTSTQMCMKWEGFRETRKNGTHRTEDLCVMSSGSYNIIR